VKKLSASELNRLNLAEFRHARKHPVAIVLDNVRSMFNIGSVFRTADAFLVEHLHLCGITATPPNKEIHKTALGATESVQWTYYPHTTDCLQRLKSDDYLICAVELTDQSIPLETWIPEINRKIAFIFGNEVNGISDEVLALADLAVGIPQFGTKHSLNISVCAGIVIHHCLLVKNSP